MKTQPAKPVLLAFSEHVYRVLLALYPAAFRHEYGEQMTQVFRDVGRDIYRNGSTGKLLSWWVTTLFDLLLTAIAERRKAGFAMSQERFIQWSGWFCILAGIFFLSSSVSQLQADSIVGGIYQFSLYALIPGMTLVMLGLLGVLLRYKSSMNLFGKFALLTALVGAGITAVGWLLTLIVANSFWSVFMTGWVLQLAGQSVFGGFAVTTRLLPRWNFVFLIGSVLPLTVIAVAFQQVPIGVNGSSFAMLMLISIGWLLTGWTLNNQPASSLQIAQGA